MSRVSYAYAGFGIALVIGLWAILSLGSAYAHAPQDMAGQWTVSTGGGMKIEQSGRFFLITFDDGWRIDAVLKSEAMENGHARNTLSGGDWNVTMIGQNADEFDFNITGPTPQAFHAHRVERTYQSIGETAPATSNAPRH